MKINRPLLVLLALCLLCLLPRPAGAWWAGGHKAMTLAAAAKLPLDAPAFLRERAEELAEMSVEPDNWKHVTTPHLRSTEHPEHFIDLEYLGGAPIPEKRYDLLKFYYSKKIDPSEAGLLPSALIEGYERLMLAFRDLRGQPDSENVKRRIVVYAGWLAHYAEDAAMPLHTTKYFNGKPGPGKELLQKGIHAKIDAYPERNGFSPKELGEGLSPAYAVNVWPVITAALEASHAGVEKCYQLDAEGGFDTTPEKARPIMLERSRAAVQLTLDLWYSAWKNSEPEKATIR